MPPLDVELFMDYHCPYSHRAVAWLDALEPERVRIRHRLFALEQVNRDPDAREWRLWEQPIDYGHYRERQDRRALAPFLATAVVEEAEAPEVARAFRAAVYRARFEEQSDISSPELLETLATGSGARPGRVGEMLQADAAGQVEAARAGVELSAARRRIAEDWAAARADYAVFGVPTMRLGADRPFYLRLAAHIPPEDGGAQLDALLAFRTAMPDLLELKAPEEAAPAEAAPKEATPEQAAPQA